jgi:hypothetical protein
MSLRNFAKFLGVSLRFKNCFNAKDAKGVAKKR